MANSYQLTMKPEFAEFLKAFVKQSTFSNRKHLPSFWVEAEVVLEKFPDKYVWPVEPSDKTAPWVTDITSLNAWYWGDIVKRINALLFFNSAKLKTLLDGIERAAVESNLLVLALLLRSLFENCATLYALAELVEKRFANFNLGKLAKENVVDKAFEDELIVFSHGSRFNWTALTNGDLDAWMKAAEDVKPEHKQKNVLTRIDKVAKEKRYSAFRVMYAWLCDYVHPNLGSHILYVRDEAIVDGNVRMELGRVASRQEAIRFLEPFTPGILSCLEIISKNLTKLVNVTEPSGKWCKKHYADYVRRASARS